MTTHKASETCSCGGKIDLDVWGESELRERLSEWRASHRHDKAPATAAATTEAPAADPGSVTTTASTPRSGERPPVFGFAPRRRL